MKNFQILASKISILENLKAKFEITSIKIRFVMLKNDKLLILSVRIYNLGVLLEYKCIILFLIFKFLNHLYEITTIYCF